MTLATFRIALSAAVIASTAIIFVSCVSRSTFGSNPAPHQTVFHDGAPSLVDEIGESANTYPLPRYTTPCGVAERPIADGLAVKEWNQAPLGDAKLAFAAYIVAMHDLIHPFYAQSLESFAELPSDAPVNDPEGAVTLELAIEPSGELAAVRVVSLDSSVTLAHAAIQSVKRAAPFGPTPTSIRSTDCRVYLHYVFHRDRDAACSSSWVFPFVINVDGADGRRSQRALTCLPRIFVTAKSA